jgi:hypothetical protein
MIETFIKNFRLYGGFAALLAAEQANPGIGLRLVCIYARAIYTIIIAPCLILLIGI